MPMVDFEGAWYSLKADLTSKRSWGLAEIAELMARLEVRHRVPVGQEGFDDRPPLIQMRPSPSPPADERAEGERDIREPASVVS